jgi:hypothetical protein
MNAVLDVPDVPTTIAEPSARPHLAADSTAVASGPADPHILHLLRGSWVSRLERRGDLVVLTTSRGGVYALDVQAIELAAMAAGLRFRAAAAPLERVR